MMDNERRADLGQAAVSAAAKQTGVYVAEHAGTSVVDVLAYIAHFCDRIGLPPQATFMEAIESYFGDFEDGPPADHKLDAYTSMAEQLS